MQHHIPQNSIIVMPNVIPRDVLIERLNSNNISWLFIYPDYEHFKYGYNYICITEKSIIKHHRNLEKQRIKDIVTPDFNSNMCETNYYFTKEF